MAAALAAAVLAGGCTSDDEPRADDPFGDRITYRDDRFVDLPPSPVGDWPQYGWAFLVDGSGFVHAGAARQREGGEIRTTTAAAYYSFDERRFRRLPDIPVDAGLGRPSGVRVGDHLVLVGHDCPPTPTESFLGVTYCDYDTQGAKSLFVLRLGDERWRRYAVPDAIQDFDISINSVVGAHGSRVVVRGGQQEGIAVAEFDVSTNEWTDLPAPPTFDVPYGRAAAFCLVGDELVAYAPPAGGIPGSIGIDEIAALRAGSWVTLSFPSEPPVGELSQAACARGGMWLNYHHSLGPRDASQVWFDPRTGLADAIRSHERRMFYPSPSGAGGNTQLHTGRLHWVAISPDGVHRFPTPERAGYFTEVVGRYVIDLDLQLETYDPDLLENAQPRILRMGVDERVSGR